MVPLGREANAARILAAISPRSSLFVQLPAPTALVNDLDLAGAGRAIRWRSRCCRGQKAPISWWDGSRAAESSTPGCSRRGTQGTRARTSSPCARARRPLDIRPAGRAALHEVALTLQDDALRLTKILGWCRLESPSGGDFSYQLILRRLRDKELVKDTLRGGEEYDLALRPRPTLLPSTAGRHYVYAFTIDSKGKSVLLFPVAVDKSAAASADRRTPANESRGHPPAPLGLPGVEPYGIDTYFLLTSDEPIDPSILEWDAYRRGGPRRDTPSSNFSCSTASGKRASERLAIPKDWSIERHLMRSVPADAKAGR